MYEAFESLRSSLKPEARPSLARLPKASGSASESLSEASKSLSEASESLSETSESLSPKPPKASETPEWSKGGTEIRDTTNLPSEWSQGGTEKRDTTNLPCVVP